MNDNIDGDNREECRGGNRVHGGLDGVTSENEKVDE